MILRRCEPLKAIEGPWSMGFGMFLVFVVAFYRWAGPRAPFGQSCCSWQLVIKSVLFFSEGMSVET